jgi:hypothetical protein
MRGETSRLAAFAAPTIRRAGGQLSGYGEGHDSEFRPRFSMARMTLPGNLLKIETDGKNTSSQSTFRRTTSAEFLPSAAI